MELHFAGTANVFVLLPVLEKGEVRATALRSWERGMSGRWHIHCAIELPSHLDAMVLERLIRDSWAKVEWGHGRILVRDTEPGASETKPPSPISIASGLAQSPH